MTSNVDFGILLSLVSLQPPYIAGRNCIVSLKKIHLEHIGVRSGSKHSKIDSPHCGYIFHILWTFFPPLCSTSAHFVKNLRFSGAGVPSFVALLALLGDFQVKPVALQ